MGGLLQGKLAFRADTDPPVPKHSCIQCNGGLHGICGEGEGNEMTCWTCLALNKSKSIEKTPAVPTGTGKTVTKTTKSSSSSKSIEVYLNGRARSVKSRETKNKDLYDATKLTLEKMKKDIEDNTFRVDVTGTNPAQVLIDDFILKNGHFEEMKKALAVCKHYDEEAFTSIKYLMVTSVFGSASAERMLLTSINDKAILTRKSIPPVQASGAVQQAQNTSVFCNELEGEDVDFDSLATLMLKKSESLHPETDYYNGRGHKPADYVLKFPDVENNSKNKAFWDNSTNVKTLCQKVKEIRKTDYRVGTTHNMKVKMVEFLSHNLPSVHLPQLMYSPSFEDAKKRSSEHVYDLKTSPVTTASGRMQCHELMVPGQVYYELILRFLNNFEENLTKQHSTPRDLFLEYILLQTGNKIKTPWRAFFTKTPTRLQWKTRNKRLREHVGVTEESEEPLKFSDILDHRLIALYAANFRLLMFNEDTAIPWKQIMARKKGGVVGNKGIKGAYFKDVFLKQLRKYESIVSGLEENSLLMDYVATTKFNEKAEDEHEWNEVILKKYGWSCDDSTFSAAGSAAGSEVIGPVQFRRNSSKMDEISMLSATGCGSPVPVTTDNKKKRKYTVKRTDPEESDNDQGVGSGRRECAKSNALNETKKGRTKKKRKGEDIETVPQVTKRRKKPNANKKHQVTQQHQQFVGSFPPVIQQQQSFDVGSNQAYGNIMMPPPPMNNMNNIWQQQIQQQQQLQQSQRMYQPMYPYTQPMGMMGPSPLTEQHQQQIQNLLQQQQQQILQQASESQEEDDGTGTVTSN
jgi:hypothetical protein